MAEKACFLAGAGQFKLTEEMHAAYKTCGYILVKNLLSQEEIGHVRKAVIYNSERKEALQDRPDGQGQGLIARMSMWRHPGEDITGTLLRVNKIAGTLEELMGGDEIYHYHAKLTLKEAKTGGAFIWHQDYGYWYHNGCLLPEMGSVFVPVDDCLKENGCLQVLTGSHRMGRIDHVTVAKQLTADPERLLLAQKQYPLHHVEMKPGDILFFDALLLHCSSPNLSEKRRYVVIGSYNKKINNPHKVHHHALYTPMEKLDDCALLECSVLDDPERKQYNIEGDDVSFLNKGLDTMSASAQGQ